MFKRKDRQLDVLRTYQQALMEQGAMPSQTIRAPTRPPGFVSDYVVPLCHALTWGVLGATLGVILYNQWGDPKSSLWLIWLEYFLIVVILAYVLTSAAVWRLLWMALENTLKKDLDNSGGIGDRPIIKGRKDPPSPRDITGRIAAALADDQDLDDDEEEQEVPKAPKAGQIAVDYPFKPNESTLQWFVRVSGLPEVGTGIREWEPLLGRKRYQTFRDSLIDAGWARWSYYDTDGTPMKTQGWCYDKDPQEVYANIS